MAITNPKTEWSKRDKFSKPDECYTPEEAIYPLLPYLKNFKTIWDCAFGSGRLAEHFNKFGYNVVGLMDYDFLKKGSETISNFDVIITNPPYSQKDKFLKRAFEIGKPFAFLLPLTTLEGIKRGKMFRENHIQVIIPNRRINFEIPSGKKSSWFATAWFCYKFNLPQDLMFVELQSDFFKTQGVLTEPSLNKDLEVSASPTPKESQKAIPSLNPDIKRNFGFCSKAMRN